MEKTGNRFLKRGFCIILSILIFANVISLACVLSTDFKQSIIKTFSSFDVNEKSGNYFYNLFDSEGQFKNEIELNYPIKQTYENAETGEKSQVECNALDVGLVFSVHSDCEVFSNVNGLVVEILGEKSKSIKINANELNIEIYFLNLNAVNVGIGDNVKCGDVLGSVKNESKLYFFVLKDKERLGLVVKNGKIVISE